MSGVVRVRLLGEMHVETGGGYVRSAELPGRQGRLVLAKLALSHFPVPRDELAEVVWPDRMPKSWERDLSAVISKIRALFIGVGVDDPIANAFGCYQLKLGDWRVDINEASSTLEDAESAWRAGDIPTASACADVAVEMLRRPFFPGEDSDWISARRSELDQLAYRAWLVACDAHSAREMFPEAQRYARRMIEVDPYREAGYAALVRSMVAAGDRVTALQTYERARELFIEELGVAPGEVLEAAYQLALNADPDPLGSDLPLPAGIVALLFTDVVGSVAHAVRLGPDADDAMRKEHFRLLRDAIAAHEGREVKNLGDGLMVVFASTNNAVDAAIAIQKAVADRAHASLSDLQLRIGIHVGEPVLDGDDYFGMPVAIARRLCDAAQADQILVSDLVRGLSRAPELFGCEEVMTLKGMVEPTTTWRVNWRGQRV